MLNYKAIYKNKVYEVVCNEAVLRKSITADEFGYKDYTFVAYGKTSADGYLTKEEYNKNIMQLKRHIDYFSTEDGLLKCVRKMPKDIFGNFKRKHVSHYAKNGNCEFASDSVAMKNVAWVFNEIQVHVVGPRRIEIVYARFVG